MQRAYRIIMLLTWGGEVLILYHLYIHFNPVIAKEVVAKRHSKNKNVYTNYHTQGPGKMRNCCHVAVWPGFTHFIFIFLN